MDEGMNRAESPQGITITIMEPVASLNPALLTRVDIPDQSVAGAHLENTLIPIQEDEKCGDQVGLDILNMEAHDAARGILIRNVDEVVHNVDGGRTKNFNTGYSESAQSDGSALMVGGEEEDSGSDDDANIKKSDYERHCLVCNGSLPLEAKDSESIPLFMVKTSATERKVSVILSDLVGQKLTARKAHSDIVCQRCFNLLNSVDSLEVELREKKEKIVTSYQETISLYGGRARRRRSTAYRNKDFIFPKIEVDNDALPDRGDEEQMDDDDSFEPDMGLFLEDEEEEEEEEEMYKQEQSDRDTDDEEWEPNKKRIRRKHGSSGFYDDGTGIRLKRRRGRPRKEVNYKEHEGSIEKDEDCMQQPGMKYRCQPCDAVLRDLQMLKEHFNTVHNDARSIRCPLCRMQMPGDIEVFLTHCDLEHRSRQNYFRSFHQKNFSPTRESEENEEPDGGRTSRPRKRCPYCSSLVLQHNLKRHINGVHTKEIAYPCPSCPNIYHDSSHLRHHVRMQHSDENERRHLCEQCGKKFVTRSDLKIHVTGVHQNIRRFVCEVCGVSFKCSSALTYHRRSHTGERPHSCNTCSSTFAKPSALAKHVRNVHRLEYEGKYRKRPPKQSRNMGEMYEKHKVKTQHTVVSQVDTTKPVDEQSLIQEPPPDDPRKRVIEQYPQDPSSALYPQWQYNEPSLMHQKWKWRQMAQPPF